MVYFRLVAHAIAVNYSLLFARELPILTWLILPFYIHVSSVDIKLFMKISFNYIHKTIQFDLTCLSKFLGDVNWAIFVENYLQNFDWIHFAFCITFKLFFIFKLPNFLLQSSSFLSFVKIFSWSQIFWNTSMKYFNEIKLALGRFYIIAIRFTIIEAIDTLRAV